MLPESVFNPIILYCMQLMIITVPSGEALDNVVVK